MLTTPSMPSYPAGPSSPPVEQLHQIEQRYEELMRLYVEHHGEQRPTLLRRALAWLWPLPCYAWPVQREARRFQAVELAHEVAVLKALLALERASNSGSTGGGGKRKPTEQLRPPRRPPPPEPAEFWVH